jgi:hypothetical protein
MTANPVFVAGCPRSGTSALSWAIAAHPEYWTSAETHFFYYLLRNDAEAVRRAYSLSSGPGQWLDNHGIEFIQFLAYLGVGFDQMMRRQSGGHHWVDGSPENALVGKPLLQMFPTAHMVLVVRDPRSVCLSMMTSGFAAPWAKDLDAAIREWRHYTRAGRELAAAHPDRVLEIRQEGMREDPDRVALEIADRLNLTAPSTVATFLSKHTINSSFDRNSYAQQSPFRDTPTTAVSRDDFLREHGSYILHETGDLAAQYGYYLT